MLLILWQRKDKVEEWQSYSISVGFEVKDGKFESVTVTPGNGYDDGNSSYFKKAITEAIAEAPGTDGDQDEEVRYVNHDDAVYRSVRCI